MNRATMPGIRRVTAIAALCLVSLGAGKPAGGIDRIDRVPPFTRSAVQPRDADLSVLRRTYLAAVRDGDAIPRGLAEIERIRAGGGVAAGSELDATLTAYRGALVTLRAKHAAWPPHKLRYMREGLALLDGAVDGSPDAAEARYLRLMSCYYLPSFFGRRGSVRQDFAALARLLPSVRARYPAELYGAIARFVVERGSLDPERRQALEATLAPDA